MLAYYKILSALFFVLTLLFSPLCALCSDSPKDLIEKQCSKCHPTSTVYDAKKNQDEWGKTIDRMIAYGTNLGKEEREAVIQYLLKRK
jgi:hypothetical protein